MEKHFFKVKRILRDLMSTKFPTKFHLKTNTKIPIGEAQIIVHPSRVKNAELYSNKMIWWTRIVKRDIFTRIAEIGGHSVGTLYSLYYNGRQDYKKVLEALASKYNPVSKRIELLEQRVKELNSRLDSNYEDMMSAIQSLPVPKEAENADGGSAAKSTVDDGAQEPK